MSLRLGKIALVFAPAFFYFLTVLNNLPTTTEQTIHTSRFEHGFHLSPESQQVAGNQQSPMAHGVLPGHHRFTMGAGELNVTAALQSIDLAPATVGADASPL